MKDRVIKLATVFSGIGAIEFAFRRLHLPHEIVFACDNGEREIDYDIEKERNTVFSLATREEKQKYVDNLYKSKTSKKNYVQQSYLSNYDLDESKFFQDIILLDGKDY